MDEKTFSFSYNFETGASFTAVYIRFSAPRCLPSRRSASCVKYRYRVARVFRVLRNVICYIHRRERGWKKLTRGGKFFERKNELKRSYKHCSDASDSELLRGWKIQDSPVFWGIIPDYRFLFDFSACISLSGIIYERQTFFAIRIQNLSELLYGYEIKIFLARTSLEWNDGQINRYRAAAIVFIKK